jgi:gamma-glutamyltranspeptidase/glutathione hydrolase
MLQDGGNAADAAIAAAAVMAVTAPHMCGLGGDLFALVVDGDGEPAALNASGRAGSGADPERLRAEGADSLPFLHDIRSVTVPGCVDGLVMLHERFGTLPMAGLLAPAQRLAEAGFPVSPTLACASGELSPRERSLAFGAPEPLIRGRRLTMPGIGKALRAIAARGRAGF